MLVFEDKITISLGGNYDKGPKLDAVLLNAGAAIHIAKENCSIEEGIEMAREAIESGKAFEQLERFIAATN